MKGAFMGLEIVDLNKSFKNKKVVNNISFKMDKPGVFGLIGSNGAGKTTIIRMILRNFKYRFRKNFMEWESAF